jgi:hypothetical protein
MAPTTPAEERIVEADRALGLEPSAELVAGPISSLQR